VVILADIQPSEVFSALASIGSLAVTGYFWLVRMRSERPRLTTHLVGLVKVDSAREFEDKWDPVVVVRVAVLNLSTRPNVVLSARGSVRLADGSWGELDVRHDNPDGAFNVAPQVAVFREVTLELPSVPKPAVTGAALEGMSWREALEPAVGGQMVFRVELVALDGKTFTDEIRIPPFSAQAK
jgi:hypothetical protein